MKCLLPTRTTGRGGQDYLMRRPGPNQELHLSATNAISDGCRLRRRGRKRGHREFGWPIAMARPPSALVGYNRAKPRRDRPMAGEREALPDWPRLFGLGQTLRATANNPADRLMMAGSDHVSKFCCRPFWARALCFKILARFAGQGPFDTHEFRASVTSVRLPTYAVVHSATQPLPPYPARSDGRTRLCSESVTACASPRIAGVRLVQRLHLITQVGVGLRTQKT